MFRNPFTPNFGQVPLYLAGRDFLISEITDAFESGLGHPSLSSLLIGARGTGKTALLSFLSNEAQQRGWIVASVACLDGMLEDIYQQVLKAASHLIDEHQSRRLTGLTIADLVGLEWDNSNNYEPNWRTKMSSALDALAQKDVGLLITVDEINPGLDEMIQLAAMYQLFVREGRRVALLMAGLPSMASALLNDKSVSFLRRSSQYRLGRIEDYEVERAVKKTVESSGKTIGDKALRGIVKAAGGFPYMIQLVGFRSWQESEGRDAVTEGDVVSGSAMASKDFETRVLRATLDDLSEGDLRFLETMLEDTSTSKVSDIERRLGKSNGYVARYRRRLLETGAIEARGRGTLAFELPGLREYLPRYIEERGQ